MQHLASACLIAALFIEVWTDLRLPLALAFLSLGAFFGLLGLVGGVFLVAENAALAFRTRLSVAGVKAREQLLLFVGRGKRSSNRIVFVKLGQLFAMLLQAIFFDQEVALLIKSFIHFLGVIQG